MKRHPLAILILFLTILAGVSRALAGLTQQSSIDEVLDALDARGQGMQGFSADVKYGQSDAATGDESVRPGKVWYQANPAQIRVTFETRESGGRSTAEKLEYLLKGTDLVQRTYRTKTQSTYHVLKPGEKLNLLKLGEGPFPLPIGQKKEDVHAQFEVNKFEPKKDDPAGSVHIQLVPKGGTRLANKFKTIDVWVDPNGMPSRIETVDRNQTTVTTTDLSNVQVNPKLSDSDFTLPKITESEWQLHEEALPD